MIVDQKPPLYNTFPVDSSRALPLPSYAAAIEARGPASRSPTTHQYWLKPKPHTEITLTLNTSHAPDPSKLALFFYPTVIAGEVKLKLGKTTSIRRISVYLQGRTNQKGTRNMELIPGEPGLMGVFISISTQNLLFVDSALPTSEVSTLVAKERARDLPAGEHTFPFSLHVPTTYTKTKGAGAVSWVKSLFGTRKGNMEEHVVSEERPLPPTTLKSQMNSDEPNWYQYSIFVSIETGPGHDNYEFSKQVVILPSHQYRITTEIGDLSTPPPSHPAQSSERDFIPV